MYLAVSSHLQESVCEPPFWEQKYETDLVRWWFKGSRGRHTLITQCGQRLIILDAGRSNDGPGPDVVACHILLDDIELVGDVEMHLNAGDWYVHGHHLDAAYENVILHVVLNAENGPDIATLGVPLEKLSGGACIARRPLRPHELYSFALQRFELKQSHLHSLTENRASYDPLFLGLLEVMTAGPARAKMLQHVAILLGLTHWPHVRTWQGSRQTFTPSNRDGRFTRDRLLEIRSWLSTINIDPGGLSCWADMDRISQSASDPLLSRNILREWFVNVVAPLAGSDTGLAFWDRMPPFRKYGHEARVLQRLGLEQIPSILIQQAILEFRSSFCKTGLCQRCPLIRP